MKGLALNSQLLEITDRIYEAPVQALLDTISNLENNCHTAMIVGHNPGMSGTGNYLCAKATLQMPTCALACLCLLYTSPSPRDS